MVRVWLSLHTVLRFNTEASVRRRGNGWWQCGVLHYRRGFEQRRSVNSPICTSANHPLVRSSSKASGVGGGAFDQLHGRKFDGTV